MSRRRKKRKLTLFSKIMICVIGCLIAFLIIKKHTNYKEVLKSIDLEKINSFEKEKKYSNCLNSNYEETELTPEISNLVDSLTKEIKRKYNVAVKYEDLNSGFSYSYKEDEIIYGASLIKLVDALYLYDNNINLDETMVYESKYKRYYSSLMDKKKIKDKVSLKELMNYAISVSDNTAHIMLLDYIGFDKLKEYGKSLGATAILSGGDSYGNQTVNDTNIYLKRAYNIIANNDNGILLKDAMINDYQNYLLLDNETVVAHKYGSYNEYFHDIGIVYDENPYVISILTLHGKGNYQEVIKSIHTKINEIHQTFSTNRKNYCYQQVYGDIKK